MLTGTIHKSRRLRALILLALTISFSPMWHAACYSIGMEGIQAIQHAAFAAQHPRTAMVESSAPWKTILAQEQALAKKYFGAKNEPVTASTTSTQTTSTQAPLHTTYRIEQDIKKVAEAAKTTSAEKKSGMEILPVEKFATQQEFLKMARINFDKAKQLWSATWEKPQMFHFGMLLKPALVEKLSPGSSYEFETKGQQAVVTRTSGDELVLQCGNEKTPLGASDLRKLLNDKISVNGVQLFLDRRGNLVMQARGAKAVSLSSNTKL